MNPSTKWQNSPKTTLHLRWEEHHYIVLLYIVSVNEGLQERYISWVQCSGGWLAALHLSFRNVPNMHGVVTVRLECQDLNSPCFRKSHTLWWKRRRLCIFLWWHLNQNRIMSWMWQRSQHSNRCHGNSNGNGQRNCLPKCEVNFLLIEQTKKWAGAKRSKAKRGSKVKAHWYRYGQIFWSTSQSEWVVCYKR